MKVVFLIVIIFTALVANDASAVDPINGVVSVDARSGVVTARENASGRTFQFKLDDTALAGAIKAGQIVDADFKTGKVTVRPAEAEPCCKVMAVPTNSAVTLKALATGRTFQLTVKDARVLGMLKVGQAVDANESAGTIAIAPTGVIVK
jgi:hypothetical protein